MKTDDLISRQAAIDAIMSGMVDINDSHFENASECNGFLLWAKAEVMKLPSAEPEKIRVANITLTDEQVKEAFEKAKLGILAAEPEIIRCKDCKYMTEHYDTDGNAPYWTCSEWDSGTDYDGFCHYAERRTDEQTVSE